MIRARSWLRETRHLLVLVAIDLVCYSAWSVFNGIAPAGDIRAHIFRTLEFIPGLLGGDYTSIQYHGYAFLAGYGVGYYVATWSISSALGIFVAGYQAATIACNAMWVLTPLVLALSAVGLAGELGMGRTGHIKLMQVMLGATVLLFPGVVGTSLSGADPYMLSFAFSVAALTYGLRMRTSDTAVLGLLAFSTLSIYTESFGYFFVATVFLGLLAARRTVVRVLPVLAAVTAFSWVQLLEVSRFMAPYIEEVPVLGIGFPAIFGLVAVSICVYTVVIIRLRNLLGERARAVFVVVGFTFLAASAAVAKGSFGVSFGVVDPLIVNILPWRLVFVNLPVLLIISAYAWCGSTSRPLGLRKVLGVVSVVLVSAPILLGTYPLSFTSMPSASSYGPYSGDRLLVTGPALTATSSPVDYSPAFGYSTVSGAFGQGDPSFFLLTAYYEWSDNLASNSVVADNLMHLTGANEIIGTSSSSPAAASPVSGGEYAYTQAEAVTPILLEAPNSTEALEFALFVNLLGKDGFMLDFVTSPSAGETFGAVILPGFLGTTPVGLPTYSVLNNSLEPSALGVPLVEPFITPPFDPFGPASNASPSEPLRRWPPRSSRSSTPSMIH